MMKKLFLLLCLLFCLTVTASAEDTPRFDGMRTVVVADTTQGGYAASYMKRRLKEPFRIPYWDRIEPAELISPDMVDVDTMRQLATTYNADIVVVPVVRQWYWRQFHSYHWYYDDEIYTECRYYLTVYAYNRADDTLKSYSSRGSKWDEASILNDPNDVLAPAMDQVMEKLPYKRIPTDLEGVGRNRTDGNLETRTTDGGAKYITNQFPMAI